jgi:hypothetical protein
MRSCIRSDHYFAEGATGPYLDKAYILLANPGQQPAIVTLWPRFSTVIASTQLIMVERSCTGTRTA